MLLLIVPPLLALAVGPPDLVREIDLAQAAREERLAAYTVMETYQLRNARFSESAEMVVAVSFRKGEGKTFRVLSRRGPSFLQTSVLDRMLKEEGELSRGETRKQALITSANYQLKPLGTQAWQGRKCEVLELAPRKKSSHTLRGKVWVDAGTHNIIRIEGKPTASLSFWAGSPLVVREYTEINGLSFATRSQAVSQSFLLGKSELTIEYSDYHVDQMEMTNAQ